jgi:protoheme IX farnesyltransferase
MWKGHTVYGTAIGSVAGAVPPVVGYCAVTNRFDLGALILFSMLVLWQMPHFFAIAIYRFKDYSAAGIPVLPVKEGMFKTKVHMLVYIIAFIIVSALLTAFNYTGIYYLIIVTLGGFAWLLLSLQGFKTQNDTLWGRQMFQVSLVLITAISLVIPFDTV